MTLFEFAVLLLSPLLLSIVLRKGDVNAIAQSIQQNGQGYLIATIQALLFVLAGIIS